MNSHERFLLGLLYVVVFVAAIGLLFLDAVYRKEFTNLESQINAITTTIPTPTETELTPWTRTG